MPAAFFDDIFYRIDAFIADFYDGKRPKIIFSMPPRHGKTEISLRIIAYLSILSRVEIFYVTYSYEQSLRISYRFRILLDTYNIAYEGTAKEIILTHNKSLIRFVGRGGGLTGSGADLLIVDDILKNADEAYSPVIRDKCYDFYATTALTRLSPRGAQIIIGTRWHFDDLIGRLADDDSFIKIVYRAIADADEPFRKAGEALHPSRFPLKTLLEIKEKLPKKAWSALYQQSPITTDNQIISEIYTTDELPDDKSCIDIVSVDCSFKDGTKNDFNAITRWRLHNDIFYCVDCLNFRAGFLELLQTLRNFAKSSDTAIIIEDKANGSAVIDVLQREFANVLPYSPAASKRARLELVAPLFNAKRVYFYERIAILPEIERQLLLFPAADHDDIVDSVTQALLYLQRYANTSCDLPAAVMPFFSR